ncbi:uncharacterized protein LOC116270839 [Papio anubis]|uniref:uncharacterized protein LOC116270839 n=1 Tax=Papio anubis TaxID=9555 RepID=UPI0012ADFACD|nr:uncharacterized protein LOC116270839 [Papio anubis]
MGHPLRVVCLPGPRHRCPRPLPGAGSFGVRAEASGSHTWAGPRPPGDGASRPVPSSWKLWACGGSRCLLGCPTQSLPGAAVPVSTVGWQLDRAGPACGGSWCLLGCLTQGLPGAAVRMFAAGRPLGRAGPGCGCGLGSGREGCSEGRALALGPARPPHAVLHFELLMRPWTLPSACRDSASWKPLPPTASAPAAGAPAGLSSWAEAFSLACVEAPSSHEVGPSGASLCGCRPAGGVLGGCVAWTCPGAELPVRDLALPTTVWTPVRAFWACTAESAHSCCRPLAEARVLSQPVMPTLCIHSVPGWWPRTCLDAAVQVFSGGNT